MRRGGGDGEDVPNFSSDQVTQRGSSTYFQPLVLCTSVSSVSRVRMIFAILRNNLSYANREWKERYLA